jgi:hypothetical protein
MKYAAWAEGVLKPLNDTQVQKMLLTEHGGMNEVLADLYADTGDKRWLDLSHRFEHRAFTDPLKHHQDNLSGKHGNCQIPKLIGSAARYGYIRERLPISSPLHSSGIAWCSITRIPPAVTASRSILARPTSSARASTGARVRRAMFIIC